MGRNYQPTVLTPDGESFLIDLLNKGVSKARVLTRARVLLALGQGKKVDDVARDLFVGVNTVYDIRRLYFADGLDRAIYDAPRSGAPVQISPKVRAEITALACTEAPEGHTVWTLQMLADRAVQLQFIDTISYGSVHNILKKTSYSPKNKPNGA
jgi:transposase